MKPRAVVAGVLFRIARHRVVHLAVRMIFAHAAWVLPVRRVHETATMLAFHHPRPSWPLHVLLVPKRSVPSVLDLRPTDAPLLDEIVCVASAVAATLDADPQRCTLVVNGGSYQDVGQLHIHLVAGSDDFSFAPPGAPPFPLLDAAGVEAFVHPAPAWATHIVLRANASGAAGPRRPEMAPLVPLVAAAQHLVRREGLAGRGFALVWPGLGAAGGDSSCLHLVSGGRVARRPAAGGA